MGTGNSAASKNRLRGRLGLYWDLLERYENLHPIPTNAVATRSPSPINTGALCK